MGQDADPDAKVNELLEKVKRTNVEFIDLNFTDIFGTLKSVTIPAERLRSVIEGNKWFDGSSVKGFARISEADQYLIPDPGTFAVWPSSEGRAKTGRLICDVYNPDGTLFEGSPRNVLKRAVSAAAEQGLEFMLCPETEFFLFRMEGDAPQPLTFDNGGYFDCSTNDPASEVKKEIMTALRSLDIVVEMAHHEVAPGQHEIGFEYGPALQAADKAITLKHVIRSIAHEHGIHATFMPKPVFGINGSGMHMHISVNKDGKNLFYDEHDEYNLSGTARQVIAGVMEHIKPMTAILNPIVNSYKRLTPGYEAPVYICWGATNRSALIRIPKNEIRGCDPL
jgi:glutamine synthetase